MQARKPIQTREPEHNSVWIKTKMWITGYAQISSILILIVGAKYVHGSENGGYKYQVITQSQSWASADQYCRKNQGSLLILDTKDKITEFLRLAHIDSGDSFWTGAYRKHSPWTWIMGCFSLPKLYTPAMVSVVNKAEDCAMICRDRLYAALQEQNCICLSDISTLTGLDTHDCSIQCPGNPNELCGGRNAVSLYSVGGVDAFKGDSIDDWKNCVYILKHDSAVWVTTDCRREMPFLCKIYHKNVMEYKSTKDTVANWFQARDHCLQQGGSLADLRSSEDDAVTALPNHSEYWVGLYRNITWEWHTAPTEEHPVWCTSMVKDKIGEVHFSTETCSVQHGFICQISTIQPQASTGQKGSHAALYGILGALAWILAIVITVLVIMVIKRRKRNSFNDELSEIHTNYVDLDEENIRPSCSSSSASASTTSFCENPLNEHRPLPNANVYQKKTVHSTNTEPKGPCSRSTENCYMVDGNEYAKVTRRDQIGKNSNYDTPGTKGSSACCQRDSSSDDGYDPVWDAVKFREMSGRSRDDGVYAQVNKGGNVKERPENDYVTVPSKLFPPRDGKLAEQNTSSEKQKLERLRSKSF
ncbi:hypothetical protein CHS0354_030215 [Potamilus streckersoni]|uniref:C-type lectin domain-containing protein n=1 Tax=Potamilus streckersoni TaxID=2493646 RepID=A0AAE0RSG5_9BIVA|nr:hypothetical protein CHS0354_030215 [Potamilus streckersoni]